MVRATKAGTTLATLIGFGGFLVAWQPAKQHQHPSTEHPARPSHENATHGEDHGATPASRSVGDERNGGQSDDTDAFPEAAILSNGCTATPIARWTAPGGVDTIRVVTAAHCLCQSLTPTGTDPTHPIFQQAAPDCEARLAAHDGALAKRISVQFTHLGADHVAVQVMAYPTNAQSIRIMPHFGASEIVSDGIHRVVTGDVVDDLATLDVVPHVAHPADAAWIPSVPLDSVAAPADARYSIVGHGYNPRRPPGDAHDPGRPGIRRVLPVTAALTSTPDVGAPGVQHASFVEVGPSAGAGLELGDSGSGLIRVDGSQHHYLAGVASYRTDDHNSYFVDLRHGGAVAFVNQGLTAHTP